MCPVSRKKIYKDFLEEIFEENKKAKNIAENISYRCEMTSAEGNTHPKCFIGRK